MKNKVTTIALLFGFAFALIGWDIYVYFYGENADMITSVIWNTSREHPVVPFVVGFIMGHLFWGRGQTK